MNSCHTEILFACMLTDIPAADCAAAVFGIVKRSFDGAICGKRGRKGEMK